VSAVGRCRAAIAMLAVVAATGCSDGSKSSAQNASKRGAATSTTSTGPTTSTTSTTDAPPDLHVEALALVDMPTGWSVDARSSGAAGEPGCLTTFKNPIGALTKLNESFKGDTSGIPTFDESLAFFKTTRDANTALAHLEAVLSGCRRITWKISGNTLKGGIGVMSFPAVADDSRAFQLRLSGTTGGQSITVGFDIVLARKGRTVMLAALGDVGDPDTDLLTQLTTKAVSKLAIRVA
jgi:hypothetical protein